MDYNRRYKCKYCDYKGNRENLVAHVEDKHPEYVNDEYPASRLVYNHLNNVSTGHCIICGKPTKWNDKTWKYRRHCGSDKCKNAIKETYRKNAVAARGKYNFASDPEHLEKMLANRKISGVYTCRNGAEKTYTGSYEKNAIEFMDKVLQCDPDDIMMPGPIFEYEYNGEPHKWITDIYYVPYNLVIEVKDGGSNPNNRDMKEYREKQVAKEKAIIASGAYNYLRLTDNDFGQLMRMFTALRLAMINDEKEARKAIIQINEDVLFDEPSDIVSTTEPDFALLFIYDDEVAESVSYIGLTDMSSNYALIPTTEGDLVSVNKFDLPNRVVSAKLINYRHEGVHEILNAYKANAKIFDKYTICEMMTGKDFISWSDIALLDASGMIKVDDLESDTFKEYTNNALEYENMVHCESTYLSKLDDKIRDRLTFSHISLQENVNGFYLESTKTYPKLATKVDKLDNTLALIESFSFLIERYGGKFPNE